MNSGTACNIISATGGTLVNGASVAQGAGSEQGLLNNTIVFPFAPGASTLRFRKRVGAAPWPGTNEQLSSVQVSGQIAYAGAVPIVTIGTAGGPLTLRSRDAAGTWSAPQSIAPAADFRGLAGSPSGVAAISFKEASPTGRAAAVIRAADGTLSPVQILSSDAGVPPEPPTVALDAQGNAVASFREPANQLNAPRAFLRGYDGAGPRLTASFPAGGVAGASLGFSAQAVDVWSALASGPTWAFGDGASADGAAVTHAYAAGTFTPSVSAADALGNSSTLTGPALTVAPAGDGGGGGGGGGGGTVKDKIKPVLTKLKLAKSNVKRGKPVAMTFVISEPARVRVAIARKVSGRRKGKQCVTNRRTGKRCTKLVSAKTQSASITKVGPGTLRLATKALKRTGYTLTVTATDAAGNVSAKHTLKLKIT